MKQLTKNSLFNILEEEADHQVILDKLKRVGKYNLDEVNEGGQTPLHWTVLNNKIDLTAFLLSKGYNPDQKDYNMLSPFIAAAANGFNEVFQLLLQYSPDLTQFNRFGGTALLPSSEKGFIRVVQKALDAGVPVNHINRLGWTALLEAVILGDNGFLFRDIVEELVAKNADIRIKDFEGKTAMDYAEENQQTKIIKVLKEGVGLDSFTRVKKLIRGDQFYQALKDLYDMEESLEQLYYLGVTYDGLGEYKTAAYYYQKGLETDPQFAYYLANLYKKMKDSQTAISYFDLGSKRSSRSDFFTYQKSNFIRELSRHEEAVGIMNHLLAQDSRRVDYIFHKTNSLRALGQLQEAYDLLIQASEMQPNNSLFKEQAEEVMRSIKK